MDSLIMLNETVQVAARDVCFTAIEYATMVARVNADAQSAITYGLIIGAVAGAAGLYLGLWYNDRRKK